MIEDYIKNNLDAFDEEPIAGHFERFERKQQASQRRKIVWLSAPLAVAASVVLLVAFGIFTPHMQQPNAIAVVPCEQSTNMQACYFDKMNEMVAQIDRLTYQMDSWDQQLVRDEVANIIEAAREAEELIPEGLPANESRQLLAGCYQQNLQSLQMIAELVQETSNTKK